jgi:hypothetical protein
VSLKVAAKGERFERRNGHPLPVDGVEAADAVAQDNKAVGKADQPLVSTPDAHREPEGHRVINGFCLADRFVDVRELQ